MALVTGCAISNIDLPNLLFSQYKISCYNSIVIPLYYNTPDFEGLISLIVSYDTSARANSRPILL